VIVIHIFSLISAFDGVAHVEMPKDARILSVRTVGTQVCLWAAVDPEAPKEKRKFLVRRAGHELPDDWFQKMHCYGAFQMNEEGSVFHLFEVHE
jgi:hypothetical protein